MSTALKADIVNATPIVHSLALQLVRNCSGYKHGWIGRGLDPKSTEHATGRALDFIVSVKVGRMPTTDEKAFGDMVADWLISIANAANIRHIIWYGRIWKRRYGSWSRLTGRKGISDWHYDHIHIYHDNSNGHVPATPFIGYDAPTLEKDIEMATPKQIADALMASPIEANGKIQALSQHLAELFVSTQAQSVAVATEYNRDRAYQAELIAEIRSLKSAIEGLL